MKWEQLRTASGGIALDWDEVKELIRDVLDRMAVVREQGRREQMIFAAQLRASRPRGKSYDHGFSNGWASALDRMSESVKRLGAGVQEAPEPPEPTNTQATHDDPWTHVASLRSAMQMLGKRVDEITLNQSDDTTKMSSLRQAHERLGEIEGLHHEERIGALESATKDNIAVRVALANRIEFVGKLQARVEELENKLTGTVLSNWGFVNGQDERIKALESLPGRVDSLSNLQRDNTHMRVALANRVSDLEKTLQDLNTRLNAFNARTVAALQIGGVANPL